MINYFVFGSLDEITVEWNVIRKDYQDLWPSSQPVTQDGGILSSTSRDGLLLALAVNQASSHDNHVLFVSSLTNMVTVSGLKGCGARSPVTGKQGRSVM